MHVEWLSFTRECNLIGQSRENHWGFWDITSVSVSRLSSQDRASSSDCLSFFTSSNSRLILSSSVFLAWNFTAQESSSINKRHMRNVVLMHESVKENIHIYYIRVMGECFNVANFKIFFKFTVVLFVWMLFFRDHLQGLMTFTLLSSIWQWNCHYSF